MGEFFGFMTQSTGERCLSLSSLPRYLYRIMAECSLNCKQFPPPKKKINKKTTIHVSSLKQKPRYVISDAHKCAFTTEVVGHTRLIQINSATFGALLVPFHTVTMLPIEAGIGKDGRESKDCDLKCKCMLIFIVFL